MKLYELSAKVVPFNYGIIAVILLVEDIDVVSNRGKVNRLDPHLLSTSAVLDKYTPNNRPEILQQAH